MPKDKPVLVEVPEMKFIMVDGSGDPNDNPGFQEAIEILYAIAYAIKMSKKAPKQPEGYFDFVVPPLEGLWWSDGPFSLSQRDNWQWTLMIRQPDFVDLGFFQWTVEKVRSRSQICRWKRHGWRASPKGYACRSCMWAPIPLNRRQWPSDSFHRQGRPS